MYARVSYILVAALTTVLFLSSCQEKRQDRFEREAREYTEQHCPKRLDPVTTLDSMVFVQEGAAGNLIQYYTLNLTDEQRTEVMNNLGEIGDQNLKVIRNSIVFNKQKEAGVDFTFIYYDATKGDKIVEYHFTKEEYE